MLKKKLLCGLIFFVLIGSFLYGCSSKKSGGKSGDHLNVVTTTGMITDMVEMIGGDRVRVTGLMGPGVDPHLYKASAGDVERMQAADLIVYNGLHLEGAMAELFENLDKMVATVAVADGIEESMLLKPDEFEGAHDPHIWFDVSLWIRAGVKVREALLAADPKGAEIITGNADKYFAKLKELHQYVRNQAATVPKEKRVLITAHDAFNYFGQAYGFEVRGLQGISTVAEAGTADFQELSTFIAGRQIPAVFIESSVPKKAIEALQAAVQDKGYDVQIGGELFSDAMGDPETPEGNYIGMVKHNINTIVSALADESGQ